MTLTINDLVLGEYAERNGELTFSVSKQSGVNKQVRIPSYTTGVGPESLTISFTTTTLGTTLDDLKTLLTNGDGVYYLNDDDNHIYLGQHNAWVNVEKVSYTEDDQDHTNGVNRGTITLTCAVAKDGTGSSYTP